jgi:hypothetical protein
MISRSLFFTQGAMGTNLLGEEGHHIALVKQTQFPVLGLFVIRVAKDATI